MKDIVFYYRGKLNQSRLESLKEKYSFAKFERLSSTLSALVNSTINSLVTDFVWYIDIDIAGWETLLRYDVNDWDSNYTHVFKNKNAEIFLVPKNINIDDSATEFVDKKIIATADLTFSKYDVFFIKYDENNADKNLRYLLEKRSDVKVISGVTGIFNAHLEAAKQSTTDFFWVVDADATVIDAFDFDYHVPDWDFDVVHIWKSINPINFLEYGYGAVKLIPAHLILNADEETAVDVTTSIGAKIKIINEISNINNFATSPLNAWRSAFRECVKLSSRVIANQSDEETTQRLEVWISKGGDRPLGQYVRGGASAGKWYGETYKGNKEMLARINDYEWLAYEFEAHIKMFPPETFEQS
jgi:hypothetical protein